MKRMIAELARCKIFAGMAPQDLELLSQVASPRNFAEGEIIVGQSQPAKNLHLVISGEVSIRYKPYDGPELVVTRIRACSVLGWSAVLGYKLYTSSGVSITKVATLMINNSDLRKLIRDHPEAGERILNRLAQSVSTRWKDAQEQVKSMLSEERGLSTDITTAPQKEGKMATRR